MINETSNEDLELKTIFSFLEAAPAKLFQSSTPFWQQKAWSRKAKITGEEYNHLSIYGEQLAQKVSLSMLLFAYKYFNFKKQTLGIDYERSISTASQNILLLILGISLFILGISLFLSADSSLTISAKVIIFFLVIFPIIVPYGILLFGGIYKIFTFTSV